MNYPTNFSHVEAEILYCMIHHLSHKNVEIAGYSTLLDMAIEGK